MLHYSLILSNGQHRLEQKTILVNCKNFDPFSHTSPTNIDPFLQSISTIRCKAYDNYKLSIFLLEIFQCSPTHEGRTWKDGFVLAVVIFAMKTLVSPLTWNCNPTPSQFLPSYPFETTSARNPITQKIHKKLHNMMKRICYGFKCPYFHKPLWYNQMLPVSQKPAMEIMKSYFI